MGTMQTISVKISNNNFGPLSNVEVQFGDGGQIQQIGDMGPFSSVMITPPESTELNFTKVTVTANEGEIQVTKLRQESTATVMFLINKRFDAKMKISQ